MWLQVIEQSFIASASTGRQKIGSVKKAVDEFFELSVRMVRGGGGGRPLTIFSPTKRIRRKLNLPILKASRFLFKLKLETQMKLERRRQKEG